MDTDIRDQLDRSFGAGPPIDDLDLLLDRGHAAVRGRRLAAAASTALVAGVIVGATLLSGGGTTGSSLPPPADTSTSPTTVVPDGPADGVPVIREDELRDRLRDLGSQPLALEADGFVHTRPGVQVLRTIADPYGEGSVAVEYVAGERTFWYAAARRPGGVLMSTRTRANPELTFEEWVSRLHLNRGTVTVTVVCPDGSEPEVSEPRCTGASPSISVEPADGGS